MYRFKRSKLCQRLTTAVLSTLIVLLSAFVHAKKSDHQAYQPQLDPLVSTEWLKDNLNDPNLVILDSTITVKMDDKGGFKSVSGQPIYEQGHIPNAVYADLLNELSDKTSSLDFVMPTIEQFANAMGKLGVGKNSRVIIYSADRQVWSARLWWMMRWAGFDNAAILDGGLNAWKEIGGAVVTEKPTIVAKQFPIALRKRVVADKAEVLSSIGNKSTNIIDSLSPGHYQGKFAMYSRSGHISSAINLPSSDLVDASGKYMSLDELELKYDLDKNKRTITYCGGGVAASSVAFNLFRMGHKDVAVYMGSLQEWTTDPALPMSTSDQ